jgi:hypothetical protein
MLTIRKCKDMSNPSTTSPSNPPPPPPSKNNFIIDFLDHNGMRPIIALVVIVGAIWITLNSDKICVFRENLTQASSTSSQISPSPTSTPQPSPTSTSQSQSGTQPQIIIRDNPVCSKYFEIAALVLGGLIGLAEPGIRKSEATPERSNSENDAPP